MAKNNNPSSIKKTIPIRSKDRKKLAGSISLNGKVSPTANKAPMLKTSLKPDSIIPGDLDAQIKLATLTDSEEVIRALLKVDSVYINGEIAKNKYTPVDILVKLSKSENVQVQYLVAANPNTPPNILAKLAKHKDQGPRLFAAGNYNTPVESLRELSSDLEHWVLEELGANPSTPLDALEKLSYNSRVSVRTSVTTNTSISSEIVNRLSTDLDIRVRIGLLDNPKADPALLLSILEEVAEHPEAYRRKLAASNVLTPAYILDTLARDEDPYVTKAVAHNPSASEETQAIAALNTFAD